MRVPHPVGCKCERCGHALWMVPCGVLFLLLACLHSPAAQPAGDAYPGNEFVAGLYAGRDERVMEHGAYHLDTQMDRLGIRLSEPVNSRLDLGLDGGIVTLGISDQPSTVGIRFTGNYLGVAVGGTALRIRPWQLDYGVSLAYYSLEDRINDRHAEMDWLESTLDVKIMIAVSGAVSLYGGSYYAVHDIDQRLRGPVSETNEFDARGATAVIGVSLEADPGGFIDLAIHHGADDGLVATFSRRY